MSLRDVKIGRVNRLRLKSPEKYTKSESTPKPRKVEPDFLNSPDEKEAFINILTGLFALELVSINGIELTEDEKYYYDERAGICEFCGGLSREEAEERAFKEILENRKNNKL